MSKDNRTFIPSHFNPNRDVELQNPERVERAKVYINDKVRIVQLSLREERQLALVQSQKKQLVIKMCKEQERAAIEQAKQARREEKMQRDLSRENWREDIIRQIYEERGDKYSGMEVATLAGRELQRRLEEQDEKANEKGRK